MDALRAAFVRVATHADLAGFFDVLLQELARQLGPGTQIQTFLYDPEDGTLRPGAGLMAEEAVDAPGYVREMEITERFDAHCTPGWEMIVSAGGAALRFDVIRDAELFWPGTAEFHRRQGNRFVLCAAMMLGERVLGMLGITRRGVDDLPRGSYPIIEAFAAQAALALHVGDLARRAEQAARTDERAAAVSQQLEELAAANELLREASEKLAAQGNLESFLEAFALGSCQVTGAASGSIFIVEEGGIRMHYLAEDGRLADLWHDPRHRVWQRRFDLDGDPGMEAMAGGVVFWINLDDPPPELWPESRPWHREMGHLRILTVGLSAGGRFLGFLGLGFRDWEPRRESQIEQLKALAQMASLALQFDELSRQAEETARAEERKRAAEARAAELERTNEALQQTIDALARLERLEDFIPESLRIVARAFGAEACAFYEHSPSEMVYLRYYCIREKVMPADGFEAAEDPSKGPVIRAMMKGLPISESYLGSHPRRRSKAIVLNHATGTTIPDFDDFDDFAVSMGWEIELNVPLVVDGEAEGALVIYRKADVPFSANEIQLAENLGKQLALALQTSRIAEKERKIALAEERNRQLEQTIVTLQQCVDSLDGTASLEQFVPEVLRIVAEAFGAPKCALFQTGEDDLIRLIYSYEDGSLLSGREHIEKHGGRYRHPVLNHLLDGFTVPEDYLGADAVMRTRASVLDHVKGTSLPEFDAFALGFGWDLEINVPLHSGGRAIGALCIYRDRTRPFREDEVALAETLGKQLSFAMKSSGIAESERRAALDRQQAEFARDVHDTLAQAFTGVLLQLEAAELLREKDAPGWLESWEKVRNLAQIGLAEARRTALALAPDLLAEQGLLPVLAQLAQRSNIEGVLECSFTSRGLPQRLALERESALVRFAKEALSNATRHGRATEVTIHLDFSRGVALTIRDNGTGFDRQQLDRSTGLGLRHTRESVERLGGRFEIETERRQGAALTVAFEGVAT